MANSLTLIIPFLIFFQVLLFAWKGDGARGVDMSTYVPVKRFQCLKKAGKTFAIVRVWQSTGTKDPNGAKSIRNAWTAGFSYVDGYIFPCYKCGRPRQQINTLLKGLSKTKYGQLWLDIEGIKYWSANKKKNVAFIRAMVNELKRRGKSIGIYTSKSQWIPITGNYKGFAKLPLWYAHYDKNPRFIDFKSFGGWIKPAMKQYAGTTLLCGLGVDLNSY